MIPAMLGALLLLRPVGLPPVGPGCVPWALPFLRWWQSAHQGFLGVSAIHPKCSSFGWQESVQHQLPILSVSGYGESSLLSTYIKCNTYLSVRETKSSYCHSKF